MIHGMIHIYIKELELRMSHIFLTLSSCKRSFLTNQSQQQRHVQASASQLIEKYVSALCLFLGCLRNQDLIQSFSKNSWLWFYLMRVY